jgi:hypothetical protein
MTESNNVDLVLEEITEPAPALIQQGNVVN